MKGFYIKELRIVGDSLEEARILLEKGLNVINGPSNTGKSYVLQCIDYMFGAKKLKKIPELDGYKKIYLEIREFGNDRPITLSRVIDENIINYCYGKISEFSEDNMGELKAKHDADKEDNISKFLLKLIGIEDNKVLIKNARGEKKTLSFRGISNLSLISETKIISEDESPIFDSEVTNNTYCKSIFRYLLSQKDDVECKEIEKKEIRTAKLQAKIEYINSEIIKLDKIKVGIEESLKITKRVSDIYKYEKEIEELERLIQKKQDDLKKNVKLQDEINTKINKITLLLDKFYLLRKQYESDLKRLMFIKDGNQCVNQININYCPICRNKAEFDDESLEDIIQACNVEEKRISRNIFELNDTIKEALKEKELLKIGIEECKKNIEDNSNEISIILEKKLNPLKVIINNTINISNLEDRKKQIEEKILDKTREVISFTESIKEKQPKLSYSLNLTNEMYKEFCTSIKNTLIKWNYKIVDNVKFDIEQQDIIVNEAERKTNGKGFRAYFYSAFVVTLMDYLLKKQYPFTRVIILDSPLTTLKEEEMEKGVVSEDDTIEGELQDSMFVSIANNCTDKQIIIIENKEVPKEVETKCNHIVFTKNKHEGRYGFFPLVNNR